MTNARNDMSEQDGFAYSPLQESTSFRLIELLPCEAGERLTCRLYDSDLSACPEYEAVSYVWGSELDKVCILCNGNDIQVTRNLADALLHFHDEAKSRVLWVDSICIDQKSIAEKNHQVAIMSQIYSKASQVLIWLGKEECMDAAMAGIQLLYDRVAPRMEELEQYQQRVARPSLQKQSSEKLIMELGIPPVDAEPLKSLYSLFRSAWFTRAWTFQEAYLARAKTFHFAHYQVNHETMLQVFVMLYYLTWAGFGGDNLYSWIEKLLPMLVGMIKIDSEARNNTVFQALLKSRRASGCKLSSDCLYSLLAVMPTQIRIVPDYSKPFQQVFAEFAFSCMQSAGNLAIFHHINDDPSNSDCPTWVPDWRVAAVTNRMVFTKLDVRRYACTGSLRPLVQVSSDWEELTIQGILCDTIIAVVDSHLVENNLAISQRIAEMDETESVTFQSGPPQLPCSMIRILCSDFALYDEANPDFRWSPSYNSFFLEMAAKGELEDSPKIKKFAYRLAQSTENRHMILTSKRRLGMAFNTSKPGDVVALLFGGEVPLILRPKNGKYMLIGECFVDGIMDGEGLTQPVSQESKDKGINDNSLLDQQNLDAYPLGTESFVIV